MRANSGLGDFVDITSLSLLPFTIPVTVVIFLALLQLLLFMVTGIGFDFDADADIDVDADFDLDIDADVDVEVPVIHLDHDVDLDHDFDAEGFSLGKFLSPIGVGQVPLSIVGYAYSLSFGVTGIATSFVLAKFFTMSWLLLLLTVPLSLIVGWHVTKHTVKAVFPLLKTSGAADCKRSVVGQTGKVTSTKVNKTFGEATFTINGAINHMIIRTDETSPITKGDSVIVTGFDEEAKRPIVSRLKA